MQFEESVDYLLEIVEEARAGEEQALEKLRYLLEHASRRAEEDVLIEVCEYMVLLISENRELDAS